MRIEHVLPGLSVAGAPKMVAALARYQQQHGHRVTLHTMGPGLQLADELEGIEIIPSVQTPLAEGLCLLAMRFAAAQPDVVHSHGVRATLSAAPAAKWARVPVIVSTRHGLGSDSFRALREFPYWLGARCCDAVVGVCEAASARVADAPGSQPRKVLTIPNGAYPARNCPSGSPTPANQGFTLVNVAVQRSIKDQATLLQAFALARRHAPDLQLWLVGSGPQEDRLKRLVIDLGIERAVVFAGEQRFVGDWLTAADLFVLCSVSEGFPLALIEATAAGLPSIVTDVGAMPDVIRTCGAGTVVPVKNPVALSKAILDVARDRDRLPVLRDSIRQCYQGHYTFEKMARRYGELYEQQLKRGPCR